MNKQQKKSYESPAMSVVEVEVQPPLLDTSGGFESYEPDDTPWIVH